MAHQENTVESLPGKVADSKAPLHPMVRHRWSPYAFAETPVGPADLRTVLEAARWAPSSSNEQPWRFIVGQKGDSGTYDRVLSTLVEQNQIWAKNAPVLMLAVAKQTFADGKTVNRWAAHDVGLASGSLGFQASALGLYVHMMAGFSPQKARESFAIPEGYEAMTAVALGYAGDPDTLPDKLREREVAPRMRRPLSDMAFAGTWNEPLFTSDSD